MDIIDPFSLGKGQTKFFLVGVDYFTKWIEAESLSSISTKNVHNFVWRSIVCRLESLTLSSPITVHPLLLDLPQGPQLSIPSVAKLELGFSPNRPRLIGRHLIQYRLKGRGRLRQLVLEPRNHFKLAVARVSNQSPQYHPSPVQLYQCREEIFLRNRGEKILFVGVRTIRTSLENLESATSKAKGWSATGSAAGALTGEGVSR